MLIKAEQKFIRTSARKLRFVADGIKKLNPVEAIKQLKFSDKRAAEPLAKVIKQAVANAVTNAKLDKASLKFAHIEVNEGPTYKRWRAVSRGRAHSIFKRTSHVKITLTTVAPKVAKTVSLEPVKTETVKEAVSPVVKKAKTTTKVSKTLKK